MFKPKLSLDSQELLVGQYKHLRQRDTGGSAKSSWRITVRQLESMLRLSEAFARLHCADTVTKKHVQEAYRLLNKSIIRCVVLECTLLAIYFINWGDHHKTLCSELQLYFDLVFALVPVVTIRNCKCPL